MALVENPQLMVTLLLISALIGATLAVPLSHSRGEDSPDLELLFNPDLLTDLSSPSDDYGVKPLTVSYEPNLEDEYF